MFKSVGELGQVLNRLRLIPPEQFDACVAELRSGRPDDLLQLLEKKHLLTSYQASVLGRGRTDGLVLGGYKLMYKNASGSFARVYRACGIDDGRMVGLKVLRDRWAKDPRQVAQFRREAELCMKLRHKNIVPIYDVGSENGFHYFTMEFVEGGNLRDFIRIRGKLSPVEATRTTLDMAEGLDHALSRGMSHRDLKLTNVLMNTQGVAKLVDFGLAGDHSDSGVAASDIDGVDRALEYATLERGTGGPDNDPRTDLYFLGAIYYELLTGVPPYPPTSSRAERRKLSRYTSVRPLRSVEPNVPRSIAEIIERLMKIDADLRYQTPGEILPELRAVLEELAAPPANGRPAGANGPPAPGGAAAPADVPARTADATDTVMFIESRIDQQDVLREYFSKRGFRVLVLSDSRRGLLRLASDPPDCVVLMGRSIGDEIAAVFRDALAAVNGKPVACIAVLSENQARLAAELATSPTARVLVQPIRLRELRSQVQRAVRRSRGGPRAKGT
ncbi:MAG TPA: protein kinase [Planctomycetaceae bacterium]|nr:protein kinase [Planctomycetaceae bacterium]